MKKNLFILVSLLVAFVINFNVATAIETRTERTKSNTNYSIGGGFASEAGSSDTKAGSVRQKSISIEMTFSEKTREIREKAKSEMEKLRDSLSAEKNKSKAQVITSRLNNREKILNQFDNIINTVSNSKDRISALLPRVKDLGVDVSTSENNLSVITVKLDEARAKVAEISTLLSGSSNELTKDNKEKIKALTKEVQNLTKEAHLILVNTINLLKDLIKNRNNPTMQPPTINFSANPAFINTLGASSVLSWSSTDAVTCMGTKGQNGWEGQKPAAGSFSSGPINGENEFTLTCQNNNGSVTKSVSILATAISYQLEDPTPTAMCSYAPLPPGCTYVQGPEYNNISGCGLVLSCLDSGSGSGGTNGPTDGRSQPTQGQFNPQTTSADACPSLSPAPTGCKYVNSGEVNSCGPVLTLSCANSQ